MADFWSHCGYHLLERRGDGRLGVTDGFLGAYMARPELATVAESCDAERALHAALTANPREAVSAGRLAALADADARDNWQVALAFRDRLAAAGTVEDCYLGLFTGAPLAVPPMFIDQLAQVVLRGLLNDADPSRGERADPMRARAAELLFRAQKVTIRDGAIMAADEETVGMYAATGGFGDLGRLVAAAETPTRTIELDVLGEDNADIYWQRDERHDTVIDLSFTRPGLDALTRVLEAWVAHFTGAKVSIQPVASIADERWVWHIGLDAEATAILNDLYQGAEVADDRLARLISLFRLEFEDPSLMTAHIAGRPVYLAMATTTEGVLHLKPQNLLVNLPLAAPA
jgi:hypothetical protein